LTLTVSIEQPALPAGDSQPLQADLTAETAENQAEAY